MAMLNQLQERGTRRFPIACFLLFVLVSLLFILIPAAAQTATPPTSDTNFFTQKYLLGDWGGERPNWKKKTA